MKCVLYLKLIIVWFRIRTLHTYTRTIKRCRLTPIHSQVSYIVITGTASSRQCRAPECMLRSLLKVLTSNPFQRASLSQALTRLTTALQRRITTRATCLLTRTRALCTTNRSRVCQRCHRRLLYNLGQDSSWAPTLGSRTLLESPWAKSHRVTMARRPPAKRKIEEACLQWWTRLKASSASPSHLWATLDAMTWLTNVVRSAVWTTSSTRAWTNCRVRPKSVSWEFGRWAEDSQVRRICQGRALIN